MYINAPVFNYSITETLCGVGMLADVVDMRVLLKVQIRTLTIQICVLA